MPEHIIDILIYSYLILLATSIIYYYLLSLYSHCYIVYYQLELLLNYCCN